MSSLNNKEIDEKNKIHDNNIKYDSSDVNLVHCNSEISKNRTRLFSSIDDKIPPLSLNMNLTQRGERKENLLQSYRQSKKTPHTLQSSKELFSSLPTREIERTLRYDSSSSNSHRSTSSSSSRSNNNNNSNNNCSVNSTLIEEEEQNGNIYNNKKLVGAKLSRVASLSASQILPIEKLSFTSELLKDKASERITSVENKNKIAEGVPLSIPINIAEKEDSFTLSRKQSLLTCDSPTDKEDRIFQPSISAQSELTCYGIRAFEMPCFPNLDLSHSLDSSAEAIILPQRIRMIHLENSENEWSNKGGLVGPPNNNLQSPNVRNRINNNNNNNDNNNNNNNCVVHKHRFQWMRRLLLYFFPFGILLPFALQEFFVLINHFAVSGPKLCAIGDCRCSLKESTAFIFTYGLHVYIPFALFTPMLFFFAFDAIEKEEHEIQLRARIARYTVEEDNDNYNNSNNYNNISIRNSYDVAGVATISIYATMQSNSQSSSNSLTWDLPTCRNIFIKHKIAFCIIVLARFIFFALMDTQLPQMQKVPYAFWGPMRLTALSFPLIGFALYKTRPFLAAPYFLLDAFPLLLQLVIGMSKIEIRMRFMIIPLLMIVFERCFWYLSTTAMPKSTPVGIKIILSTAFTAIYLIVILTASLFVNIGELFYVIIVMGIQILLFELIFSTIVVEVFAFKLYTFIMNSIFRKRIILPPLKASDSTNISTQVRWVIIPLAISAIVPFYQFTQWHRAIPHSNCHGILNDNFNVYIPAFFIIIGVVMLACIITIIIRWKNHCLRAPFIIQNWFLLFLCSWYIFSSVPLALTAVL